ncbi:sugar ABC transporter substrate-binding protein [Fodinicola acaciae]|uniref:sugar ABC transporter substrate-binding protein n=1 Tax=Fodinicola acaciae TaxID=2681555 RepID=UPI0013CF6C99|nr:sugar ABC transporter substrate-binding protein [Fodinicola acaciae]
MVCLLLVAVLAMSACGRSAGENAGGSSEAIGSGPAKGAITVWAMGTEGEKLSVLAKQFEAANPGAKVAVTAIPWDAAHDKLTTAIAARKTPDVSMVGTTWMGEFARTGGLDAVPPGLVKPANFFAGPQEGTVVNRTSYGVPWYVETRVLFYRTDLAAKAAVQPPKTWPELKSFATALRDKGGARFGFALKPGGEGSWNTFMPFAWQAGASIVGADGKTFTLNSPQMVQALAYYQSFFTDKLVPPTQPIGQPIQDFVAGKTGSFVSGPYDITNIDQIGGPSFKQKYALAPLPAGQTNASFAGGADLSVFKDSKNRDTAWKFVKFLSQPDVQVKWYQTVNDLPAVKSAWQNSALANDKFLSVFGQQLNSAKSPPTISTWEQVARAIDNGVEQVSRGTQAPAAAAAQIQQQCQQIGTGS